MNPAEHPILFNGEMVNAILDGRKTQTRRPLKPQPPEDFEDPCQGRDGHWFVFDNRPPDILDSYPLRSPFGQPGDALWVRETWRPVVEGWHSYWEFAADGTSKAMHGHDDVLHLKRVALRFHGADKARHSEAWHPSTQMPRAASRLTLTVKRVWVERVQSISAEDALAEGVDVPRCACECCAMSSAMCPADASVAVESFASLWDGIYAAKGLGWDANPWVWACEFEAAPVADWSKRPDPWGDS